MLFFEHKAAYEILARLEFRRVLFRSGPTARSRRSGKRYRSARAGCRGPCRCGPGRGGRGRCRRPGGTRAADRKSVVLGKSVDIGGRRMISKTQEINLYSYRTTYT